MIYEVEKLRRQQLIDLKNSMGGSFGLFERIKRGGIGSPFMFYHSGWEEADRLDKLVGEPVRMNIEELKNGFFFRLAERTRTFIVPVLKKDILHVVLTKNVPEHTCMVEFHFEKIPTLKAWLNLNRYLEISDYLKNTHFHQNFTEN
jgi:hypothetical protein